MDNQIKLLKQWRDWHWRLMLKAHSLGNTVMASYAENKADNINEVIDFLKRRKVDPKQDRFKEFEQYKYGDWPE